MDLVHLFLGIQEDGIEVIDDVWKEGLENLYFCIRNNDIRRKDYFCFLEMNIYPKLNYGWHVDIDYKAFTGVAYIGETGTGTTLKSGDNELDVNWKHNRGLLFMNCDKERRNEKRR